MISRFLKMAEEGRPVYINRVYEAFQSLPDDTSHPLNCLLYLLEEGKTRFFPFRIPRLSGDLKETRFIKEYLWAEIYNIISSLGGRKMVVYVDDSFPELKDLAEELNDVFQISAKRGEREGYGRSVNVTDRMLQALAPGEEGFHFKTAPLSQMPGRKDEKKSAESDMSIYHRVQENLEGKTFCGIDVGGTDIKIALIQNGSVTRYKEYDWFPAAFKKSNQLVEPILLIVRLMRAAATLDSCKMLPLREELLKELDQALDIRASEEEMEFFCRRVEEVAGDDLFMINGVGMCFPDVVVRNKIVGGEVYKTRGIRQNREIDFEEDFKELTDLNERIGELIDREGKVLIINDGPMASFTAAVEMAASENPDQIAGGVFAHTLGTELGTGWVDEEGKIPDIPLEVYNYIIDLGSYGERAFEPDDLRSVNNFNTNLPGTLQKYASQSGVFRLAMKYFPQENPRLFRELKEKGYVVSHDVEGETGYYVPTEPVDMRKPFLEFMMSLPEREGDEVNKRIWREIGEFLGVTWVETKKILEPATDTRFLFGRLVKRKSCYNLMLEGAKAISDKIIFEVADSTLANTRLMKELEADEHFTVAQFAQAVGAGYFANQ